MKFGTRLAFILILVGFLPLLIGGFFLFHFFEGYLKETTYNNLDKITEITSFRVENFIDQSIASSSLLNKNEILISEESSVEEIEDEIDRIYNYYQVFFQDITFLDKEGEVIASTSDKSYGRWETNPWFMRAKATKEIVISDMYAVSNEDPIMAVFVPNLNEEEEIISFTVVQINTKPLFKDLNFKVGEDGMVIVLNERGDVIFHQEKENIFTKISEEYPLEENALRKKGNIIFNFQEQDFIASFKVIESDVFNMGWQLIVAQPEEEAFGFLRRMAINYGFLIIVFLFPIILISFMISRKVIKPLKNLSITSKRVARGDFKARAVSYTKDEFGELADNFNKMTEDLGRAKQTMQEERDVLEIKVNARTKELNEMNEKLEQEVGNRTEQIQKKLVELEKMSKLMVGRELKMIELKKELQEKEGEIERLKGENSS
jgi:two-component system, sensor histidine kinase YesM